MASVRVVGARMSSDVSVDVGRTNNIGAWGWRA